MFDLLFPVLQVAGSSLAAMVLMFVVLPALAKRRKLSSQAVQIVATVAEKVVMALEQSGGDLSGPDKKRRAEELVGEILSRLGVPVNRTLIDASIEAAVLLMNALTKRRIDR